MFSCNRVGGLAAHQQTRQFSTTFPMKDSLYGTMPTSKGFLHGINLDNISSQKKFFNPNFVNQNNANIHSSSSNLNPQSTSMVPIKDICTEFYNNRGKLCTQSKSFSTDHIMKESTQRKKEIPTADSKRSRDHQKSYKKSHKNKVNFDIKCEIDEIGIDCLDDQFESYSTDTTSTMDLETAPRFIHEAVPDIEIKREVCRMSSSPIRITIGSPEQVSTVLVSFTENFRRRMPSECSEDSFIVFQCGDSDYSEIESEVESDFDESESECSDDQEEVVCVGTKDKKCRKIGTKRVTFASDLCTTHPIIAWSYAYQAARKGPWEQVARDRYRFRDKIKKMEAVLNPVLQVDHRDRIYRERYC